ncbi:MAG: hypothetical protein OEV93_05170 [Candidatus Moranbacteria bacterium]|nr:hypothetical protein [Candidatus Moranbacteria bacterium]
MKIKIGKTILNVVAGLSSTVINVSGQYDVLVGIPMPKDLSGLPHYVGHPDTKAFLDKLGGRKTPGLFEGLRVGESFLAFPLQNSRKDNEWTVDQALNDIEEIRVTLVTRIA